MVQNKKPFGKRGMDGRSYTTAAHHNSISMTQNGRGGTTTALDDFEGEFNAASMVGGAFSMLFGFSGRIGRGAYWGIGFLSLFLAFTLYFALGISLQGLAEPDMEAISTDIGVTRFAILVIGSIIIAVMRVSIEVRRFHDRDASGFWYFGYLIPFFNIWLSIQNWFFAGTPGQNRYGL